MKFIGIGLLLGGIVINLSWSLWVFRESVFIIFTWYYIGVGGFGNEFHESGRLPILFLYTILKDLYLWKSQNDSCFFPRY